MRASVHRSSIIPSGLRPPLPSLSHELSTRRVGLRRRKKLHARVLAVQQDEAMDDDPATMKFGEIIKEIKAINRGNDKHMIELEKAYRYTIFESQIFEILGILQFDPTSSRPRLAVGLTLMVSLSMPVSVLVIMLHLMDFAKGVADRIHLND